MTWHWLEGNGLSEPAELVQVDLRPGQIEEAERLTTAFKQMGTNDIEPDAAATQGVRVESLGEREIEGVRATGLRRTTTQRDASGTARVTMREVWTSAAMHLVLRVVDGASDGDLVISGLEHLSLSPRPALFRLPSERRLFHWQDGKYADGDVEALGAWFVQ